MGGIKCSEVGGRNEGADIGGRNTDADGNPRREVDNGEIDVDVDERGLASYANEGVVTGGRNGDANDKGNADDLIREGQLNFFDLHENVGGENDCANIGGRKTDALSGDNLEDAHGRDIVLGVLGGKGGIFVD